MSKKIISHPLRSITLEFADEKPESDYEQKVISEYIALHDRVLELTSVPSKLKFLYGEHDDHIGQVEKAFPSLAEGIHNLYEEARALISQNDSEGAKEFQSRMLDFYPAIEEFQAQLDELGNESDDLHQQHLAFDEQDEKLSDDFDQYHSKTCGDLYHHYDNYSLDLVSYDNDEQEFRGSLDALSKSEREYNKQRNQIIDRYNALMALVKTSYDQWDEIKKLLSEYFDDKGLLDTSLSDSYVEGKGDAAKKPIYLVQPGDPLIGKYKSQLGLLANSTTKTIIINVPLETVNEGDTSMLKELVAVLQHFPKMIEKMVFAIDLVFLDGDETKLEEEQWKGYDPPMRWCRLLNSAPCMIFFLSDQDARAFALMGDLIADKKVKQEMHHGEPAVVFEGEMLQEICDRFGEAAWFFHLFCHNTGFDPQPFIEALLADFDLPITYDQIRQRYEEDVKKGIQLRMGPPK